MFAFFEKIRNLPDGERARYASLLSLSVTLAIFLIWAAVTFVQFKSTSNNEETAKAAAPLKSIGSNFAEVFGQFKKTFSESVNMPEEAK